MNSMKRFVYLFPVLLLWGSLITDAQEVLDNIDSNFSGVEAIHVKGVFCDVKAVPGSAGTVHLTGEIRSARRGDEVKIKTRQNGSSLEVWIELPRSLRGNVRGYLNFAVPSATSIRVENVSGNVKVNGVGRDEMWLESVSGNVEASEIPCDLLAKSVSGNVSASVIEGNLEARSVSGNLNIANVKGTLRANSVSGNLKVEMIEGVTSLETTSGDCSAKNLMSSLSAKSTSGNVNITGTKGDIKAMSISGDVVLNESVGSLDIETLSGSQRGDKLMLTGDSRFHSMSGDITMTFLNPQGALRYRLSSNSGSLRTAGLSAKKQLVTDDGSILVTGSSMSGNISLP